jgi:hypothetical protein
MGRSASGSVISLAQFLRNSDTGRSRPCTVMHAQNEARMNRQQECDADMRAAISSTTGCVIHMKGIRITGSLPPDNMHSCQRQNGST